MFQGNTETEWYSKRSYTKIEDDGHSALKIEKKSAIPLTYQICVQGENKGTIIYLIEINLDFAFSI